MAGAETGKIAGWFEDVMDCVDDIKKDEFTLSDVYEYVDALSALHPENKHVRDKIRQQLQKLRDAGYLEFTDRGRYRKLHPSASRTYHVTIKADTSETFDIEAESEREAEELARQRYREGIYSVEVSDAKRIYLSVEAPNGQPGPWKEL